MTCRWIAALVAALILSACSPAAADEAYSGLPPTPTRTTVPSATPAIAPEPPSGSLVRTDAQGAVEFVVEALNLHKPGETLDFRVTMDTHSVDLGWDLAALSTLETDTGLRVGAIEWPVGGGHHYAGTLTFPRLTADGADLLEGAAGVRLIVRDTDVPERVFDWDIAP